MARSISFEEWSGGASDEDLRVMLAAAKKKYHLYLLLSLTIILAPFTLGLAIFCYNNISIIKSRGNSTGIGLYRLILMILGLIIFPLIMVQLCAHINKLGLKVLGWDKL